MSERIGKIGLNAGTSWSLFAENTAFEDSEGMQDPKSHSAETTRLHREDMKVFGICPARDNVLLVVCKDCEKIMQFSAIQSHFEKKHPKMLSSILRSPTRRRCSVSKDILSPSRSFGKSKLLKSPGDNSFIRIEEVDPTDVTVKIEEAPLTIPKFNHASKGKIPKINLKGIMGANKAKSNSEKSPTTSKISQKKQLSSKDKEYDPEKHCGVWIEDQTRNCTRSLTCKTHSLASRREVSGRSKSFDSLLMDHRTRVQNIKESGTASGSNTPTHTPSPTKASPPQFPTIKSEKSFDPRSPSAKEHSRIEAKRPSDDHSSTLSYIQPCYIDYVPDSQLSSIPTIPHHPKPIAVNKFSIPETSGGCSFFTRKFERLRWAASNLADKFFKSNMQISRQSMMPFKVVPGPGGTCSVQVVDKGNGTFQQVETHLLGDSSLNLSNALLTENSHLGPVPRVKTKSSKVNSLGVKRQFSVTSDSNRSQTHSTSRKRRHSSDSLKVETTGNDAGLIDSNNGENNNIVYDSSTEFSKAVNEIGPVLNCTDVDALEPSLLSGSLLCTDINQSSASNLSMTSGSISANIMANMNLNSSLTLCQTMGINPGIAPTMNQNLAQNPGVQQTQLIVDQGQIVNHVVAPNVAVTQGMMVSLPNVTQVQSLSGYQANLKDILPAPSSGRQLNSSTGVYITTQGQQSLSQLPNGIVSSPDSFAVPCSPSQGLTNVTVNAVSKFSNATSAVVANKRHMVSGGSRVSQLIVRQPSQPLQTYQRDVNSQRVSPFQKPIAYEQRESQLTPTKSTQQQQASSTIAITQTGTFLNSPQYDSNAQPIAQLKQMQIQQIQQQQQFLSPLNSSVQADNLMYQQQILPKLSVSPGRSLQTQVVNSQSRQVIVTSAPQGTSAL